MMPSNLTPARRPQPPSRGGSLPIETPLRFSETLTHRDQKASEQDEERARQRTTRQPQLSQETGLESVSSNVRERRVWQVVKSYLALTKPTIMLLVIATGLPELVLASHGTLSAARAIAILLGIAAAGASAAALNHFLDRDIDLVMARTRSRPLPKGELQPGSALWFGLILGVLAAFWLTIWGNVLAASLAVASIAYYALVYTAWLKRRTPQNIVIGGAAGACAPLIASAAVLGRVDLAAWLMFAVVLLWTPPHFWSLAICRVSEYAAAGIPMLPVVAGVERTVDQIGWYSALLVPTSLGLWICGVSGNLYGACAMGLNGGLLWRYSKLKTNCSPNACMALFRFSIVYLLGIFVALLGDALCRLPVP